MYQVDPDDMEEMDLKRQMEMITLRLKKFQDKTRKRLSLGKAGFDKSKLWYYNCKNPGHFKRDCPLLKNENTEAASARRTIAIEGNENAAPNTPKALVVEDYDSDEEFAEAKEEVNKALNAKISTGSAPLSSKFIDNKNAADKGKKEAEKFESKEKVQEARNSVKKEKDQAPTATMKVESAKEKVEKDLDDCKRHVPKPMTRNHENVVVECFELQSAFCDENVVCEPPVLVLELKQNRFGKFLIKEIPEFVPSHTGMSESDKEPNKESNSENSSTTTSESGEGSSSEDQGSDDPSEDQGSDASSDIENDEECKEDESLLDKKMNKIKSSSSAAYHRTTHHAVQDSHHIHHLPTHQPPK
ncbi:uncharacterized protein LOC110894906 [Helianthus annuus]|uniref:uncharacterized protein LOC110894906 n=1 Tax=Helianthus annuus TaxID=4232 RepID=UPI000B90233D|nr:uncharacterized protein LOC110894906 [Helianthus annuus]